MEWIDVNAELPEFKTLHTDKYHADVLTSGPLLVFTDENEYAIASLVQYLDFAGNEFGDPIWYDECDKTNGSSINEHVLYWAFLPPPPVVIIT